MNAWTLFQDLFTQFDVVFLGQVQTMITAMVAYVQAPFIAGVTIWLAGTTAVELYQPGVDPMFMLIRKVARAALIIGMLSVANYTAVFGTFALTALPNEIMSHMSEATGNTQLAPVAFDTLLNGAWAGGLEVYKNISGWSAKSFGLSVVVGVYFIVSAIAVAIGFLIFLTSHVMLGLAIVFGPLCVCMLLWERTVPYFNGWIASVLSLVATQVLVVGLLAMLLPVVNQLLHQIATLNGAAGMNANAEFAQLHLLVESIVVVIIMAYLASHISDLARAIFGGATTAIAPFTRAANGAMSSAAGATARMANAVPGAGLMAGSSGSNGAAGMRSLKPAGRAP